MSSFRIIEVRTGRARPFGPRGALSGIDKTPAAGPVMAGPVGLEGDEQADTRHHGGPDKAIHAYPVAHYPLWAAEFPEAADSFVPGGFGENLVVEGVAEAGVCLGDRWQAGGALLEVSQARQPCWKLNQRFGRPDIARLVQRTERSGWYFRVLEPGPIAAGITARLADRPYPEWPLTRVNRLLYRDTLDRAALAALAALPGLPARWRQLALGRLDTGKVEDWSLRLKAPEG